MDFTKFVSMLEDEGLFFCRADCFDDPFEGSYPKAQERLRPLVYADIYKNMTQAAILAMKENQTKFIKWQRQWIMINCWHMNEYESAAMWKLYAKTNEAICIQSTYERLHQCLDEETYIGEVQYIDYQTDWMSENNTFYPFMHKRKSFAHERELRALTCQFPTTKIGFDFDAKPPSIGMIKKVNLNQLIVSIYVAPSSPIWFHELVMKVVAKYGLHKSVVQSSLDDKPFY